MTHSPARRALMELTALLNEIRSLADQGSRERYFSDSHYRWVIHRLWIAIGNETQFLDVARRNIEPWRSLRLLRNQLAHVRLPDIDDDKVWRITAVRPEGLAQQVAAIPY